MATRRIDEPSSRLDQRRCGGEDRALLGGQLDDARLLLPPFQIGVAAQRAESAARRIDQHAIDLARETLDLRVVLAVDQHRVHVRQATAREAR